MHLSSRQWWAVFWVLLALLIVGTTMPGWLKSAIEDEMPRGIPWSGLAHFSLFALIAACPVYGSGKASTLRAVGLALGLALLTELLQSLAPGRHPTMRDGLIDLAGTAAGIAARTMLTAPRQRAPK